MGKREARQRANARKKLKIAEARANSPEVREAERRRKAGATYKLFEAVRDLPGPRLYLPYGGRDMSPPYHKAHAMHGQRDPRRAEPPRVAQERETARAANRGRGGVGGGMGLAVLAAILGTLPPHSAEPHRVAGRAVAPTLDVPEDRRAYGDLLIIDDPVSDGVPNIPPADLKEFMLKYGEVWDARIPIFQESAALFAAEVVKGPLVPYVAGGSDD